MDNENQKAARGKGSGKSKRWPTQKISQVAWQQFHLSNCSARVWTVPQGLPRRACGALGREFLSAREVLPALKKWLRPSSHIFIPCSLFNVLQLEQPWFPKTSFLQEHPGTALHTQLWQHLGKQVASLYKESLRFVLRNWTQTRLTKS